MIRHEIFLTIFALCLPFSAHAAKSPSATTHITSLPRAARVAWVAPTGSDTSGNGSEARPFLTVEKAASEALTVVLKPGRYTHFGTIRYGGSPRQPLVVRSATPTSSVEIALQDAAQPARIASSHVRLQGITIHGAELERPGACIALQGDVEDVGFSSLRLRHCDIGIDVGSGAWSNGTIEDSFFSDLHTSALDCGRGACLHQRLNRVTIERSGTAGAAVIISDRSQDIRWRDVVLRDIAGDGAIFYGARPSIANSQFIQIQGTALHLYHGGYLTRVDIATLGEGLRARVGADLVIERSLLRTIAVTSTPLMIEDSDTETVGTLLLAYSRVEVPTTTLMLGGPNSHHDVVWQSSVFWFHLPNSHIKLPGGAQIVAEESLQSPLIYREGQSQVLYGLASREDLFAPLFVGGDTIYNGDGSRTISSGSQLQGEQSGAVYVLGVDDRAHFVPNEEQRKRWYSQGDINILSEARLGDIPRGFDLTEPPGTLVKTAARPHVYLVTAPNLLRWITTEELAAAYAGPRWASTIITLGPDTITQYEEAEPIDELRDFEATDILRQIPDPGDVFDEK